MNFDIIPYIKGPTIAATWPKALYAIVAHGRSRGAVVDQRGDKTFEVEGLQVVITDPLKNMIPELPKIAGVTAWGSKARLDEYYETEILCSRPKPEGFDYVYGDWIWPQLDLVIQSLRIDNHSRRAIITLGCSTDCLKESPPCLRSIQFLIRDDALNMITTWRSRDYAGAAATNMYGLIRLQEHVAKKLDLPVGTYTDFSGSAHIRIRDDLWWVEKVIK